jgi:hypothetical protein
MELVQGGYRFACLGGAFCYYFVIHAIHEFNDIPHG